MQRLGLVSTIRISGLEITDEKFKTLKKQFQRHAVSPENAAKSILKGVKNNDYYIFTSPDIKFGNWGKDKFTFASEWIMQIANDFFQKTMKA